MKKLTSMLSLLAVAAGLTAAVAMAPAPEKTAKSSFAPSQWFRISDGTYLGSDTQANKQAECGNGTVQCVRGYEAIDQDENPVGNPTTLFGDKAL